MQIRFCIFIAENGCNCVKKMSVAGIVKAACCCYNIELRGHMPACITSTATREDSCYAGTEKYLLLRQHA